MSTPARFAPDDPRTTAFRWLVSWLKNDPALQAVTTWLVWDGTNFDAAELPLGPLWVRLTPAWEPEQPVGFQGRHQLVQANVTVTIEHAQPGTNADNAANLAGLIYDALSPAQRPALRTAHKAAGISWIEFGSPPADVGENAASVGTVILAIHLIR